MAVDNFIYQGINRAVSDFTGAQVCEELINLRPTEGGLVPVKDFSALFSNVGWEKVFVHYTTSGPKYIVVKRGSSAVEVYYLTNASDPTSLSSLFSVTGLNTDAKMNDVLEHLYFAAAGNILLFSICTAPTTGVYENHAFTWKLDESTTPVVERYVGMEANVPQINFQVKDNNTATGATTDLYEVTQGISRLDTDSSATECTDALTSALNAAQEENPELCLGPVIIAIAYKTTDGQVSWTDQWRVYDPIPTINTDSASVDTYYYSSNPISPDYDRFFDKYDSGYLVGQGGASGGLPTDYVEQVKVRGTHVRLEFSQLDTTHPAYANYWNKNTSSIQSLEIYCSKPQMYLNSEAAKDGLFGITSLQAFNAALFLPQTKYEDMDLGGQLLYYQASIPMESLAQSAQTVNLTFGGSIQMTEETLDADAGALQRFGRILSYNARFHYFDSLSKIKIGMPYFHYKATTSNTGYAFARYQDDDQSEIVYLGATTGIFGNADIVIAPSINIKEVIYYSPNETVPLTYTYRMTPSTTYNYSIFIGDGSPTSLKYGTNAELAALIGSDSIIQNVEPDAINVTEQYNPFVFRVEHSYKAPGNIIDVQPQMAGIVDASYGRDPLNVFTERGLYALTQGSADVLYGAFLPLSNLKAGRGGIPVESGTYFLADGNLWLVSGRRVVLISEALTPGPHKFIRACLGYKKISGQDSTFSPTPVVSNPIYDASPYLSQVTFEEFVRGNATAGKAPATLSYNRFRMELYVSSRSYDYSYVLSLKNAQWHKISRKVWQDEPGSPIINIPGSSSGTISILDMANEVSTSATPLLIHLQSRPFSMGYQYAHVHRIVAMMRVMLASSGNKITAGLYGSDDLQHWNLLAYGRWAGKTEEDPETHVSVDTPVYLSQVRTPSAARSWRYYTVCIGGLIPVTPDFPIDLGPVLIDYEPVVRRIG